mmetsp:Transcript_75450/g.213304  ORF Transcript_75450/g.213304 Transcript_75450/m.213304 type:complete len:249 (+) Transcript_75450:328-1074(+)
MLTPSPPARVKQILVGKIESITIIINPNTMTMHMRSLSLPPEGHSDARVWIAGKETMATRSSTLTPRSSVTACVSRLDSGTFLSAMVLTTLPNVTAPARPMTTYRATHRATLYLMATFIVSTALLIDSVPARSWRIGNTPKMLVKENAKIAVVSSDSKNEALNMAGGVPHWTFRHPSDIIIAHWARRKHAAEPTLKIPSSDTHTFFPSVGLRHVGSTATTMAASSPADFSSSRTVMSCGKECVSKSKK